MNFTSECCCKSMSTQHLEGPFEVRVHLRVQSVSQTQRIVFLRDDLVRSSQIMLSLLPDRHRKHLF
jgi:hypothetical protein